MKRGTFAVVFLLCIVALGAIIAGDVVASGFHGESCRTRRADAERWESANEWLILQAAIFVPYLVVLWGVAKVLASRLMQTGSTTTLSRLVIPLGVLAFVGFALNGWHFALNCGQETGPSLMPNRIASLLIPMVYAAMALLAAITLVGFLLGLRSDRQRGNWNR